MILGELSASLKQWRDQVPGNYIRMAHHPSAMAASMA
jgi:hypothetical protein